MEDTAVRETTSSVGRMLDTNQPGTMSEYLAQQPTVELERLKRKRRLAAAYRVFARFKFDMGGAGHITARDPEHPDCFWVNPAGVHFSQIRVSDLMLVDHHGKILEAPAKAPALLNGAAFAIHSRLHAARPDVIAAAHSHSLYGKSFSTLGKLLDPITQDSAAFYQDHALFDRFSGVVFDVEEGDRLAEALGDKHALILQNHGLLTVGETVDSCVWRYLSMENACQTQLIAMSAGKPIAMDAAVAAHTQRQVGAEAVMAGCFQPYWQWITAEEPDLLD
jgi:ribulose-5-phosphate 4-epimerase/fuculose-1-phosphate aldolase